MRFWDYTTPRRVAIGILVTGLLIFVFGYIFQHPEGWNWNTIASDFYANISTELISIAITVLVIDSLYTYHEIRAEKKRLILELGSPDNGIALRALNIMRQESTYLFDGSLSHRTFLKANLNDAILEYANLEGTNFHYASIVGANFNSANLKKAVFWRTDLRGTYLLDADLSGASIIYADLEKAKVTRDQLKTCYTLQGTILPNGKIYDGSYRLEIDIHHAKLAGIDVNDPVALQEWHSRSYSEYLRGPNPKEEESKLSDWDIPS